MNARACQLCGKPLSRLRVGGDGDFCSKDHRNQFRLRAGMDRLEEVNKVANLMRRRESARPITSGELLCRGVTTRHAFGDLLPGVVKDSTPRMPEMRTAGLARAGVSSHTDHCVVRAPEAARGTMPPARTHQGMLPMATGRTPVVSVVNRRHHGSTAFPRLGIRSLGSRSSAAQTLHREFANLPAAALRVHLGEGPQALKGLQRRWTGCVAAARHVQTWPMEGNALRVSIGVGFRVPQAIRREPQSSPVLSSIIQPLQRPKELKTLEYDANAAPRLLPVQMPPIAAQLPHSPAIGGTAALDGCSVMTNSTRMLRDMPALDARAASLSFTAGEPALQRTGITQAPAGFARRNGARFNRLPMRPQFTESERRITHAPIQSREELLVPKIPYCNVLAAASGDGSAPEPASSAPAREAMLAPVERIHRFEENFDAGWDNWVGGTSDWKVDVAGVRTGSMALYIPTLDLGDYDLEFLARIDNRSVTWLVRAAGAEAHLRCTLTAMEGGLLEFSHAVVQDGVAETPVIADTRAAGKQRATFTVRMSVNGSEFGISVDGKTIDSWVDDRLATGGIGFVGTAEDRARLYWVRVTSPPTPGKEHTT